MSTPPPEPATPIRAAVVTVSDRSSRGEREDVTGPLLRDILRERGAEIVDYRIIPDDQYEVEAALISLSDRERVDLILTNGGTGLAPRDVTPEGTYEVLGKEIPGMSEAMRAASLKITPHAMLSRAVCGARGETLIINLPGSPKAASESFDVVWPALSHAVDLLHGRGLEDHSPVKGEHRR